MIFDPNKPYNDLPLLPPGADVETKPVLKKTIAANRALAAVEETATFTSERILVIRNLMLETMEQGSQELPRRVFSQELIELLFRQPYCKISLLVDRG